MSYLFSRICGGNLEQSATTPSGGDGVDGELPRRALSSCFTSLMIFVLFSYVYRPVLMATIYEGNTE